MGLNQREQWEKDGYLTVRGIFGAKRTQRLRDICKPILQQWRAENPETGQPGGDLNATVMRHLNHPGYFTNRQTDRMELMEAIADAEVLAVCRNVFGEASLFRCTSLFMNPTEKSWPGNWHRDSQFRHTDEDEEKAIIRALSRSGKGVQMQIALVPSDDVEFVPGSHVRWDTPDEYQIRRAEGGKHNQSDGMPGAVRIALEPGDAVLFNPYGIHRGRYHSDKLRRTLMFTYTKASEPHYDYFSHQPWFLEPGYLTSLKSETYAFFESFVDAYKTEWL